MNTEPKRVTNIDKTNIAASYVKQQRVQTILEEYIAGKTRGMIVNKYSEDWGLSTSTIDKYLAEVREIISEEFATNVEWLRCEYHKLYHNNLKAGKTREAKEVLDSMFKMIGVQKIQVDSNTPIQIIKLVEFINSEPAPVDYIDATIIQPEQLPEQLPEPIEQPKPIDNTDLYS